MKKKHLIIFIHLIVLLSCTKEVDKKRPEFIGSWSSDIENYNEITLIISENSSAHYTFDFEGIAEYKGTAKANNKRLYIGNTNYFDIIEYPHMIDTSDEKHYTWYNGNSIPANWKMVLYGLKPSKLHMSFELTLYKLVY